jgi:hypothetical protein
MILQRTFVNCTIFDYSEDYLTFYFFTRMLHGSMPGVQVSLMRAGISITLSTMSASHSVLTWTGEQLTPRTRHQYANMNGSSHYYQANTQSQDEPGSRSKFDGFLLLLGSGVNLVATNVSVVVARSRHWRMSRSTSVALAVITLSMYPVYRLTR